MPDTPVDALDKASSALGAVLDLLVTQTQDDMHMVHPARLYCLLDIIHEQIKCAQKGFCKQR